MNISELSPAQLRQAASLKEKIARLESQLAKLIGSSASAPQVRGGRKTRRKLSAAVRAKMATAQKARWAKIKAAKKK